MPLVTTPERSCSVAGLPEMPVRVAWATFETGLVFFQVILTVPETPPDSPASTSAQLRATENLSVAYNAMPRICQLTQPPRPARLIEIVGLFGVVEPAASGGFNIAVPLATVHVVPVF